MTKAEQLLNEIRENPFEIGTQSITKVLSGNPVGRRGLRLGFEWLKANKKPDQPQFVYSTDERFHDLSTNVVLRMKNIKIIGKSRKNLDNFNVYKISFKYTLERNGKGLPTGKDTDTGWLWVSNEPEMPDVKQIVKWIDG